MSLNFKDQLELSRLRLSRLREFYPELIGSSLVVTSEGHLRVITQQPQLIQDSIDDFTIDAYLATGANQIEIYCNQHHIQTICVESIGKLPWL